MSRAERWRQRVIDRLWANWIPRDRTDHELKGISLRFIGMSKDGTPDLRYAAQLALGTTWDKWLTAVTAREAWYAAQLHGATPDYDPQDGPYEPVEPGRMF